MADPWEVDIPADAPTWARDPQVARTVAAGERILAGAPGATTSNYPPSAMQRMLRGEDVPLIRPDLMQIVKGNPAENLPELGTRKDVFPNAASPESLKMLTGYLLSSTPKQIADIAKKAIPGATIREDKDGNPIVKMTDGREFYINRPGLSEADVMNFAGALVAYAPAGKLTAAIPSWVLRAPVAAVAGTATSAAIDKGLQAAGSDQPVDWTQAFAVGGVNAAMSPLARFGNTGSSREEIKAASQRAYKAAEQFGVMATPQSFRTTVNGMMQAANDAGFDRQLHPKAARVLERFSEEAQGSNPFSFKRLEILRHVADDARGSTSNTEANIGRIITRMLDDYVQNLSPSTVTANAQNTRQAVAALNEARKLWTVQSKARTIEMLIENANLDSKKMGWEQALRSAFRPLARDPDEMTRFTAEEQTAIREIVRGGRPEAALAVLRRFIGNPVTAGAIGLGGGYAAGGTTGAIAGGATAAGISPIIGETTKELAGQVAQQRAADLLNSVRGGRAVPLPFLPGVGAQGTELLGR